MKAGSVLAGRQAIVTGGTRGIGRALVEALLEHGASVLLCARRAQEVEAAVAQLRERFDKAGGAEVYGVVCDVSDEASVRALFAEAEERFGGLDILLNNAGVGGFCEVERMSASQWQEILTTNLTGVFYCCREAVPHLRRRGGGYIINIGSLAGREAFAGAAAYCASKFGLVGFTEALMQEVRFDHIRVSYVMPGSVNTGFRGQTAEAAEKTWKLLPEDVAAVVINLLEMPQRALPSRVELRPAEPARKS